MTSRSSNDVIGGISMRAIFSRQATFWGPEIEQEDPALLRVRATQGIMAQALLYRKRTPYVEACGLPLHCVM